jgi:hypothetical protein
MPDFWETITLTTSCDLKIGAEFRFAVQTIMVAASSNTAMPHEVLLRGPASQSMSGMGTMGANVTALAIMLLKARLRVIR